MVVQCLQRTRWGGGEREKRKEEKVYGSEQRTNRSTGTIRLVFSITVAPECRVELHLLWVQINKHLHCRSMGCDVVVAAVEVSDTDLIKI